MATVHRAESTDEFIRLRSIVDAFCVIGNIVFPCHPRTEKFLKQFGLWDKLTKKVKLIKPIGYPDMLMLDIQGECAGYEGVASKGDGEGVEGVRS